MRPRWGPLFVSYINLITQLLTTPKKKKKKKKNANLLVVM